jgi:hypothetical protein
MSRAAFAERHRGITREGQTIALCDAIERAL